MRAREEASETFLLEIGMEELPAQFAGSAAEQVAGQARQVLAEWGLSYEDLRAFVTPRRLALWVRGLPRQQPDLMEEVKGPSCKAAYDAQGAPTKALQGFMRGQGVTEEDIFKRELNGTEYVYAHKRRVGQPTEVLLPDLMARVIGGLTFPKPMRWGELTLRFARPVRWLVALYGERGVPFQFAGLTAGNITRGHRTLGGDVSLRHGDDYIEVLRAAGVVADQEERKSLILAQMAELERSVGGKAEVDEELLTEIVHIVEHPTVFCGKVDARYLALPEEVITTPMKQHQRYFPVRDGEGRLLPVFFGVRNGGEEALDVVIRGNERVLKARLEDAAFYYREDANRGLEDYVRDLDGVGYHDKLGSVGQRVERLRRLAGALAERMVFDGGPDIMDSEKTGQEEGQEKSQGRSQGRSQAKGLKIGVDRAALLAKADLVTKMVYDFPELQGIMGGYYASLQGDSDEVALAIREHYLPRAAGDELPRSRVGRILGLADRLDALTGFFGAGIQPTGSQDPFALRRQAQGMVALLMDEETGVQSSLAELVELACDGYAEQGVLGETQGAMDKTQWMMAVEEFCLQRVRYAWLEGQGKLVSSTVVSYDAADAALARAEYPYGNICLSRKGLRSLTQQVRALSECRERPDFVRFLNGYTRCVNLSRKEFRGGKGSLSEKGSWEGGAVLLTREEAALLTHEAERTLLRVLERTESVVNACLDKDDYVGAFDVGMESVAHIETLFDAVMIMDPDPKVKQARLALLSRCVAVLGCLGDLTLLAG
ncbi:MAG: glycine--tRNA ligase subunit beta [Peptococcaceae bacterium]|nr:glycine--tRNA ligase subunit beta [Peptococcaceae bacterium]